MSQARLRIAIVGGGIGGLMFAISVRRFCEDVSIDIYEAQDGLNELGAGFGVWRRGWELLRDLGVADDFSKIAHKGAGNFLFRKADQEVGVDIKNIAREYGLQTFHRAEFLQVLCDRLPPEYTIHFSKRLTSYTYAENGDVTLHFQDGSTATTDLVVGCDGIRSPVRGTLYRHIAEEAKRAGNAKGAAKAAAYIVPKYSGTKAYRGLVQTAKLLERYPGHPGAKDAVMRFGKNKHFVIYPVSSGERINVAIFISQPELEGQIYTGPWMVPSTKLDLAHEFSLWEEETKALVECMDEVFLWAINVVTGLPTYVGDRVAILGDAAHAMAPHQGAGAGQAFEDGYVLAALLAHPDVTRAMLASALRVYDAVRRPFSQDVQRRSRRTGMLYELNAGKCAARSEVESAAGAVPWEQLDALAADIDREMAWMMEGSVVVERKEAVDMLEGELVRLSK